MGGKSRDFGTEGLRDWGHKRPREQGTKGTREEGTRKAGAGGATGRVAGSLLPGLGFDLRTLIMELFCAEWGN